MSGDEIETPVLLLKVCCRIFNLNLALRRHLEAIPESLLSVEFGLAVKNESFSVRHSAQRPEPLR